MTELEYGVLKNFQERNKMFSLLFKYADGNNLSIVQKDMIMGMIIDFCKICQQKNKGQKHSSWDNYEINQYVQTHQPFYQAVKTFRDKFFAHLDQDQNSEQELLKQLEFISKSMDMVEFNVLVEKMVSQYENQNKGR